MKVNKETKNINPKPMKSKLKEAKLISLLRYKHLMKISNENQGNYKSKHLN